MLSVSNLPQTGINSTELTGSQRAFTWNRTPALACVLTISRASVSSMERLVVSFMVTNELPPANH